MSENNIISFSDYLKRKQSKIVIDKQFFDALSEDIKTKPELIEWYNFQSFFNKHKLFLHALYTSNHEDENISLKVGYFLSFTQDQLDKNINKIIEANEWLQRTTVVIDATNCTFNKMATQLYDTEPSSAFEAWNMFNEMLLESNKVLVISSISKSKIPSRKSSWARSIIKIIDDAHFKGIKPKSDLIFVDSAFFLERSWPILNNYINIFA